jgi:molybdopterin synthase catalytic subunit
MQTKISIQKEDFDIAAESEALCAGRSDIGAAVTFSGLVRGDNGLTAMTLEHYPGMTEREIAAHVEEAGKRWPLLGVTVIHRVGRLKPAPFWKLEARADGSHWVDARNEDDTAAKRWE